MPGIQRYMRGLMEDPTVGKFLVFAHHHGVLDTLQKTVFKDVEIIRIDGRTGAKVQPPASSLWPLAALRSACLSP